MRTTSHRFPLAGSCRTGKTPPGPVCRFPLPRLPVRLHANEFDLLQQPHRAVNSVITPSVLSGL